MERGQVRVPTTYQKLEEVVRNRFHINKVFRDVNGEVFENNDSNKHEEE